MAIKIALPKGRLLAETAALLDKAGWGLTGYHSGARVYRLQSGTLPGVSARMFHEKDIPIQVVMGNYDLGICGLDWIEELLAKYPSSALVRVKNLAYGSSALYLMADDSGTLKTPEALKAGNNTVRIVSEYPNLAASIALKYRLKWFNIFPVWGAAEAYPPENAELILVSNDGGLLGGNLVPVCKILDSTACLIANINSRENKDLNVVLKSLEDTLAAGYAAAAGAGQQAAEPLPAEKRKKTAVMPAYDGNAVWLALPDGHQQKHVINLLNQAGISIHGYHATGKTSRPVIGLENVPVKVIRPQDMPLQVANGNFDIAISGKDWLVEHLNAFPSSPVTDLLELKFGRIRIVAVVSADTGINNVVDLRRDYSGKTIRLASEYVNIADDFARRHRLGMYRVIPTWGASEAFVPEDADVLIENTETGQTLLRHNLKIIDTLLESTPCLIGNKFSISHPQKGEKIKQVTEILRRAGEKSANG